MISFLFRFFRPRIVLALLMSFAVLVIPALITVLSVSYYQSEQAVRNHVDNELGRTRQDTTRAISGLFKPLVDVVDILAVSSAIDEQAVRSEAYNDVLYQAMLNSQHLLTVTVVIDDVFIRSLSRITPDNRTQHPDFPADALWVLRVYDSTKPDASSRGEVRFYKEYPTAIETRPLQAVPSFLDSPAYVGARTTGKLFMSDAFKGPVSHLPVVGLSVPVKRNGTIVGAILANITVSDLSAFLNGNRISPNSESMIVDSNGQIVASSSLQGTAPANGAAGAIPALDLAPLEKRIILADRVSKGAALRSYSHSYTAQVDNTEFSISDFPITNDFGLKYRALIFTPMADIVGDLHRSRQQFTIAVVLLLLIEMVLMVKMARRMSRRVTSLSEIIRRIREMDFGDAPGDDTTAPVQEIRELQQGVGLLKSALRSFALYVPFGVVKKLARDGKALAPGVEKRPMTILFCDLENFSTMAQAVSPEDLLQYTTRYFSIATQAITRNGGTVDKFIGDAVMAFWGAPDPVADHAVRACRAAVELVKGLEAANREWRAEEKLNLRVRVGINSANVLVGNIGSPDRLSYTALGDGVNVASRLEGKNKELGSQICISDSTYELAKEHIVVKPLKPVSVKGRTGEFMVYELFDAALEAEGPLPKAAQS